MSFRSVLPLSAVLGLALASPAGAQPAIRTLIIDGQNNHQWRLTTPVLKRHLEAGKRFTVDVTSHLKSGDKPGAVKTVPFPPDLSKYDVVVSNYNGAPWPEGFNKDLERRLSEGTLGLVIVHAANNSFPGWKEYNDMIGMGWRDNKFGDRLILDASGKEVRVEKGKGQGAGHGKKHAFAVTVRDAEHPVTKGMPREWMHTADELYHGMRGPVQNVKVLATAFDDRKQGGTGEHEPMIWTVTYGKGRVFHTPMGHDLDGLRCVGFAATLQRGTEWAATGKVTIPLPENFPTTEKTSSVR
ncbi:MAG: ThuA domain-containing protein [Gemmataceae bacterium]